MPKQELAILIPNIKWAFLTSSYEEYEYSDDDIFVHWMIENKRTVCKKLFEGQVKPERVYFGNEFCERLLWSAAEVSKMITLCEQCNMRLSLLTPYCTDEGIEHIASVISKIGESPVLDEVIVNDWGTLYRITTQFPRYRCIFGRVLDKMKRDPRLGKGEYVRFFNPEGLKMLQSPSASSRAFQHLMSQYHVERFELDNVPQGLYLDNVADKQVSVYVPYGYVTNGKICQFAGIHNPSDKKFRVTSPCQCECQSFMQLMQQNRTPFPTEEMLDKVRLIRKGNTVFYMNAEIDAILHCSQISRIIYEPIIPM